MPTSARAAGRSSAPNRRSTSKALFVNEALPLGAFARHMQHDAHDANVTGNIVSRQSHRAQPPQARGFPHPLPNVAVREGKLLRRRPLHIARAEARHVYPHPEAIDLPIGKTPR